MTIGEKIRDVRKQKGLTQKELADRIGISYVNISRIETGDRNPSYRVIEIIADAMGVSVSRLTAGKRDEAEWIYDEQGNCFCGNCKIRPAPINPTPYCPYCGSKMTNQGSVLSLRNPKTLNLESGKVM